MAIDPAVLAKQRAIVAGVRVPAAEPAPRVAHPMTEERCPSCRERFLAARNTTGVCYVCWSGMSAEQRRTLRPGAWKVRPPTRMRARAETIERARAKLAAKGITVEAA